VTVAVNQVSLFFYPPCWGQRLTPSPTARTDQGLPVQVAEAVPLEGATGTPVAAEEVKEWLIWRGFTQTEWGRGSTFERGLVWSVFGPEKEIEVNVGEYAGELTELYCRFTLPRHTPPLVAQWSQFVAALCGQFGLRLGAHGDGPCGEVEFTAAVQSSRNYQEFATSFGWELASDDPPAWI
jgi:hypothetical protein